MTIHLALQQGVPGSAAAARSLERLDIGRWVYLGEDTAWRINAERGGLRRISLEPVGDRLAEVAARLRDPFIEWIGELSTENASPEWWACELAAKNPYMYLFSRLCALAVAREALADLRPGTLVVCSSSALLEEVTALAGTLGVPARLLWDRPRASSTIQRYGLAGARRAVRSWATLAPGGLLDLPARLMPGVPRIGLEDEPLYRRRVLAAAGAGPPRPLDEDRGCLLVTWADDRNVQADGSYIDPHFGPLADLIRRAGMEVAYLPRVLATAPFEPTVRRLVASGEQLVFADSLLTNGDLRWCRKVARDYRPRIPPEAAVGGIPVARLAAEHVDEHREQHRRNLMYLPLARRLAEAGVRPRLMVLPFEGHAWEQALTEGIRRQLPGTEIVGYDNLNFSRLALSLYPAPTELAARPVPDRVVTNGPLFRRILLAEGFPEDRVRVGCALRHAYLWEASSPTRDADAGRHAPVTTVLVAGSIDVPQTVELVDRAATAFGSDDRYQIEVKLHPAADAGRVRELGRRAAEHRNLKYVERPIRDLLDSADLMLYTYSVVCYEALAAAVPPVFVASESFLDLDQLEPFPGLGWRARTPSDLRDVAAEIVDLRGEDRAAWARRAAESVREAFEPESPDCVSAFLE